MKKFLEVLRGKPIAERSRSVDVPCIETSDRAKLCKHPVVSVHMITYNHEPYIRQAIEGVMMQQTDFEFELVIGEDCSKDKTREVCFEYQRKYPDKIRVLWWHENVFKLGGNGTRVSSHCRGEFIAFCEGDDYWTDPLKLQKQVNAMRANPTVTLCFCNAVYRWDWRDYEREWDDKHELKTGLIKGDDFFRAHLVGAKLGVCENVLSFIMTATVMLRRSTYAEARRSLDVFSWVFALGDSTVWLAMTMQGDAYYISDIVSVYRQVASGACVSTNGQVGIDSQLVRIYFAKKKYGLDYADFPMYMIENFWTMRHFQLSRDNFAGAWKYMRSVWADAGTRRALFRFRTIPYGVAIMLHLRGWFVSKCLNAYKCRTPRLFYSKALKAIYSA